MFGALGGILIAKTAGNLFDYYKADGHIETGYLIMFLVCSVAYIIAWIIMQLLVPKMKRIVV
jgi:ACS family hexuronate transporter-like MFS transporter